MVGLQLDGQQPPDGGHRRRGLPGWVFVLAGVLLIAGLAMGRRKPHAAPDVKPEAADLVAPPEDLTPAFTAPPPPPLSRMVLPTPQTNLLDGPIALVIQPTASGRPESGLYGSVRTANFGRQVAASFHEGIDIAPTERDRSGRARDAVFAAADGRVGYVSPYSGNSNYGKYVVLLHDDPVGEVYTLYAHFAEIASGIAAGKQVKAGTVLGRMGNTPPANIPVSRSHMHFEIGLIANNRFASWMVAQKTKNSHGRYNGWNFFGVDPLVALQEQHRLGTAFTFLDHLGSIPVAYELVVPARRLPDYFERYPPLWQGDDYHGPALVLACAVGGLPLHGRAATAEEAALIRGRPAAVLSANAEVLGRNGRHIVITRGGDWVLGPQGRRWLDIFLY
ncbi:MAG: M23 family metallopeptidase [Lentisphaerae bacterium]|nr:M23 family metallopeptidase [Lentisphaerota bacterium]